MSNIIISAGRFLDLLMCVLPACSTSKERWNLTHIELNVSQEFQSLQAIATDGAILSIASRPLGFSVNGQDDLEDLEASQKIEDRTWLLKRIDAKLLISALKNLKVRRGSDDENNLIYLSLEDIREKETAKLKISMFGDDGKVVLEPIISLDVQFPNWRRALNENSSSLSSVNIDFSKLDVAYKCWGGQGTFISFMGKALRITRHHPSEDNEFDLIIIMPFHGDEADSLHRQMQIVSDMKKNEALFDNPSGDTLDLEEKPKGENERQEEFFPLDKKEVKKAIKTAGKLIQGAGEKFAKSMGDLAKSGISVSIQYEGEEPVIKFA
jgi:hypothetical protein